MSDWDKPKEDMVNEMLDRKILIKTQAKEIEKLRAALNKISKLNAKRDRYSQEVEDVIIAALGEKE